MCVLVSLHAVAPRIIQAPVAVIVNESDNATFVCQVYGLPLPVVTWLYVVNDEVNQVNCSGSGVPALDCMIEESIEGERNRTSTLELSSVMRSIAGEYVCSSANDVGERTTSANLTVYCKFVQ